MRYIGFKNKHKKEDKHPDYCIYQKDENGDIIKDHRGYQKQVGALWISKAANGTKYFSLSIDSVEEPAESINPEDLE